MKLDEINTILPHALSILAFFISVTLLFWGMRYFTATKLEDVSQFLTFTIPSIWMMLLALYLWQIGREDAE